MEIIMKIKKINKKAFTLAEILITLGIIGVIAAITIPALINKTKNKELHTAFLKTFSELNQLAILFIIMLLHYLRLLKEQKMIKEKLLLFTIYII